MYRVGKEEAEAVSKVILSGSYFKVNNVYGETEKAENEMKELFGVKNALLMTSGMAAIVSGLTALGIGPGDQVIVPAYTYIATAMAVVAVGAVPVIAECDEGGDPCAYPGLSVQYGRDMRHGEKARNKGG